MDFRIRDRTISRGSRALTRERAAHLDLVRQGYSNREACRIVGINVRTGKRWRNGRQPSGRYVGAPPITSVAHLSVSSRFLSEDERIHIADRYREGAGVRVIARELGRAPSTISREIRRNGMPLRGDSTKWAYRPHAAHRRAGERRRRPKVSKIAVNPRLGHAVQELLDRRWSPEQIAQQLRRAFPGQPGMTVTHETIYQALRPGSWRPAPRSRPCPAHRPRHAQTSPPSPAARAALLASDGDDQ